MAGRSESVAVLVTVNKVNSLIVRFVCAGSDGGVLTSVTTTVNVLVVDKDGEPSSVTAVRIKFVLGACDSVGVQTMTPLVMVAPLGGLISW